MTDEVRQEVILDSGYYNYYHSAYHNGNSSSELELMRGFGAKNQREIAEAKTRHVLLGTANAYEQTLIASCFSDIKIVAEQDTVRVNFKGVIDFIKEYRVFWTNFSRPAEQKRPYLRVFDRNAFNWRQFDALIGKDNYSEIICVYDRSYIIIKDLDIISDRRQLLLDNFFKNENHNIYA